MHLIFSHTIPFNSRSPVPVNKWGGGNDYFQKRALCLQRQREALGKDDSQTERRESEQETVQKKKEREWKGL